MSARADEIDHIGGFHARMPGSDLEMAGGVDEHGGHLRSGWRMLGPES
jgi:hypothetical protein